MLTYDELQRQLDDLGGVDVPTRDELRAASGVICGLLFAAGVWTALGLILWAVSR